MATKERDIEFALSLDLSSFRRTARLAVGNVERMGSQMRRSLNNNRAFETIENGIKGIGIAAGIAAATGLYAFTNLLRESIALANEQEAAESNLNAVLEATGEAAGFASDELKKYAADLQKTTTFGDEVTISALAILATFKQVKGDSFKRATEAAQDMSTVLKTDLKSSILQIGKALQDPTKGLDSLNRAGVRFTDTQKDMIKELQASGDLIGAQNIILKELEGQFGGAAAAARNTFGGGIIAAQNALGDLQEEIGFAITKNEFFIKGIELVEAQIVKWTETLKANRPEIRQFAKDTALSFIEMSEAILTGIDVIFRAANGLASVFDLAAASANLLLGSIIKVASIAAAISDALGLTSGALEAWNEQSAAAFDAADEFTDKMSESFKKMVDGSEQIQTAKDSLKKFREEMEKVPADELEKVEKNTDKVTDATDDATKAVEGYTKEIGFVGDEWTDVYKEAKKEESEFFKQALENLKRLQDEAKKVKIGTGNTRSSGFDSGSNLSSRSLGGGTDQLFQQFDIQKPQQSATAGAVGGGGTMTVKLDFGAGRSIPVQTSPSNASALVEELKRMSRRQS